MRKVKVDDPLDAFAAHGSCGVWGVIALAFFHMDQGLLYGAEGAGELLGWQLCGVVAIFAWTGALSAILCTILKKAGLLRLGAREEEEGGDSEFPTKAYTYPVGGPAVAEKGAPSPAVADNGCV